MAIWETKGQGWRVILTQWMKASDILTSAWSPFCSAATQKGTGIERLIMAALSNRAGNYIFALWFLSFSSFFSLPNLSGRRLDVYHTLAPGVALVWIYNAGLKCAARGLLEIHDAKMTQKNHHLRTIAQLCRAISSQVRHVSTIWKKNLLSSTEVLLINKFFPIVDMCLSCDDTAPQSCAMVPRRLFLCHFCVLYFQRAACSTFQTCILNSH